jgi:nucleoside-diphosphate-sugar epimerase
MRVVVAGGAGFLGSHVCDALVARGDEVVCLDNLLTGRRANIAHLDTDRAFEFVECDVGEAAVVQGSVDAVMHLASAASPRDYLALPLETLAAGSAGTKHLIDLALAHDARFFLASTSEVYGDPQVHPQPESYWGHVNPIGERSVYDEAKRFAEALTVASRRTLGLDSRIVRIFNTYGPRMKPDDGRVVSNFIVQALRGDPLTIYGDGTQTRSFCYVDDEVRGFLALLDGDEPGPVNIGNPGEFTMLELAHLVLDMTGSKSEISFAPMPADDPTRRRPDIALARRSLGWEPAIDLRTGLESTIPYFAAALAGATS